LGHAGTDRKDFIEEVTIAALETREKKGMENPSLPGGVEGAL